MSLLKFLSNQGNRPSVIRTVKAIAMKSILCPVSLTVESDRTAEYAAQLAKDNAARLVLAPTRPTDLKGIAGDWPAHNEDLNDELDELHDKIKGVYSIPIKIEKEIISEEVPKKINAMGLHHDLVVVGARFCENKYPQPDAGYDLIQLIGSGEAPLMIVPQDHTYRRIKRLLYAFDYRHEPDPPLKQLQDLSDLFHADVKFVSVLPKDMLEAEREEVSRIEAHMARAWESRVKLKFENIVYDDVAECLKIYLQLWRNDDLLVLSVNHRKLMARLWNKSVVRRLLQGPAHPYLIIHG